MLNKRIKAKKRQGLFQSEFYKLLQTLYSNVEQVESSVKSGLSDELVDGKRPSFKREEFDKQDKSLGRQDLDIKSVQKNT